MANRIRKSSRSPRRASVGSANDTVTPFFAIGAVEAVSDMVEGGGGRRGEFSLTFFACFNLLWELSRTGNSENASKSGHLTPRRRIN